MTMASMNRHPAVPGGKHIVAQTVAMLQMLRDAVTHALSAATRGAEAQGGKGLNAHLLKDAGLTTSPVAQWHAERRQSVLDAETRRLRF